MITFTITNKQRPTATIIMLVGLFGRQYRKSIGVGVPAKCWNDKKKCARTTADFDGGFVNMKIEEWEDAGKRAVAHFTSLRLIPSPQEFTQILKEFHEEDTAHPKPKQNHFCDYLEFVYTPRYTPVRGEDTVKTYHTTLNKLHDYEAFARCKLSFENINIDFYNKFQRWFYNQDFSANYFANIIKVIKQVYREARDNDKLHSSNGIEHRDFIAPQNAADSVYLTTSELDKIFTFALTHQNVQDADKPLGPDWLNKKVEALKRARGLFLIGCYTGLRVSDFSRLRSAHIGDYITIKTAKTGAAVVIPIHPVVKSIIDGGFDLEDTISDQKLNEQIKELCRLVGITEEVLVNKNVGGKSVEVVLPKYKLVASHTARRSFATNAYKAGVPTIAIMKITGHTKESTFLKYIRVSAQENAEILSHHPFFMKAKKQDEENLHPVK